MSYAEKYLPKNIKLFLLTPPEHNKYKLKRTKIVEVLGNKLIFTLKLRQFCKKNNIDLLVNLGSPNETFAMLLATLGLKTEYTINLLGNIWKSPKVQEALSKKAFLFIENFLLAIPFIFAKRIIQPSSDINEKTKKYFFFIKNKIEQAHLIIDEKMFSPKSKIKARKKLNLPLKKPLILFIGRISYLKGSDLLMELAKKNPNKLFILIGKIMDNKFSSKLNNLLILQEKPIKELVDYYNSADLFIFPSRMEGYGLVPREAMLCQTPALVSDIESLRLIKPALKAKLSVEEMQEQIDKFFAMSEKEREELGKLSRKYIIKENSYKNLKDKHRDLLLN
jgi:glycosyltransferase involved in cell wall biosynthesis